MKLKALFLLFFAVVFASFAHAQTTTSYTITTTYLPCGYTPATPYCPTVPFTNDSDGTKGTVFLLNGNLSFGYYEGLGTAVYTSNDGLGHIAFKGTDSDGSAYTGTVDFTYTTYLCGRWHNLHCWAITGGTLTVTK